MLVDREREIRQLTSALERARAGVAPCVLVIGDSGTGKSFLLDCFFRDAERIHTDLIVACGSGQPLAGREAGLQPVREILEHLTGLNESQSSAIKSTQDQARLSQTRTILRAHLVRQARDLIDVVVRIPLLSMVPLTGKALAEYVQWIRSRSVPRSFGGSAEPPELRRIVGGLLKSAPGILALVIDDIQWVDSATLDLFFGLQRELMGRPAMLVAAAMTGAPGGDDLAGGSTIRDLAVAVSREVQNDVIDLNAARRERGRDFCRGYLKIRELDASEDNVERLLHLTGANALFVRDTLDRVAERSSSTEVIASSDTQSSLSDIDWAALPRKHADNLDRRLAQLDQRALTLLETAAVEGQEFTVDVLATIHKIDRLEVLEILDKELRVRHRLVDDISSEPMASMNIDSTGSTVARFKFDHGFYRQHIYETRIGPARRRELHGRIARALEILWRPQIDVICLHLARHFELAGDASSAIKYYAMAARRNLTVADFRAAAHCAQAGLALATNLQDPRVSRKDCRILYETATVAARVRGLFREAEELARQGLAQKIIVQSANTKMKLKSELARSLYNQDVSFQEAEELLRDAIRSARSGRMQLHQPDLHRQLGIVFQRQARYFDALGEYLVALDFIRPEDAGLVAADIVNSVGVSYSLSGFFDFAIDCQETALHIANEDGNHTRDTLFLNDLASALRRTGKLAEALKVCDRSAELAHHQGKLGALARAKYERAQLYRINEDWPAYETLLRDVLTYEKALGGQGPVLARARSELVLLSCLLFPSAHAQGTMPPRLIANGVRITGTSELYSPDLVHGTLSLRALDFPTARGYFKRLAHEIDAAGGSVCWAWPFLKGFALLGASRCVAGEEREVLSAEALQQLKVGHTRLGLPSIWGEIRFWGLVFAAICDMPWPPIPPASSSSDESLPKNLNELVFKFRERFATLRGTP